MHRSTLVATMIILTIAGAAHAADWTKWRGPDGTGYVPDGNPPVEWNEQSIRWKVPIPGSGHASPIILGDRIYLMTAIKGDAATAAADAPAVAMAAMGGGDGQQRGRGRGGRRGRGPAPKPTDLYEFAVLALDRADGSEIWRTTVRKEVPHEGIHRTGSYAGGTPVTDGEHLYAFFGSRGLYCLDLDGKVVWEKDLGDMTTRNTFGEGASVAVHGDTVVVPWDHEGDSFAVALDKATGDVRWKVERDEPTAWTTPVVVEVDGRTLAIIAGHTATVAYDITSGEPVWTCGGMTMNVIPTPIVANGMVYLTSGFRGSALQAIKLAGASGDLTDGDSIVWSFDRGTPYVPSPMLAGDYLYLLRGNNGIVSCFDARTGEPHFVGERLEGIGDVYASIVGAGEHLYICGREGAVIVLAIGPEMKVVATNDLGEGIDATPSIVGNEIYVRGSRHLFCFAPPKAAAGQ